MDTWISIGEKYATGLTLQACAVSCERKTLWHTSTIHGNSIVSMQFYIDIHHSNELYNHKCLFQNKI